MFLSCSKVAYSNITNQPSIDKYSIRASAFVSPPVLPNFFAFFWRLVLILCLGLQRRRTNADISNKINKT